MVNVKPSRIVRRLIALDETCIKVNGLEYWVYAALDVDRNEIISMRVYPSRNAFFKQALEELGLPYNVEPFR